MIYFVYVQLVSRTLLFNPACVPLNVGLDAYHSQCQYSIADVVFVPISYRRPCTYLVGGCSGVGGPGFSSEVLLLFHATPVNSKESEAALETWKQLTGPLMGFAQTGKCALQTCSLTSCALVQETPSTSRALTSVFRSTRQQPSIVTTTRPTAVHFRLFTHVYVCMWKQPRVTKKIQLAARV